MVWVIQFCSPRPVAELNRWLGTRKILGVDRMPQTSQVHINSHAYTCIHHRIQLAVGDTTMSGWKPTISLILPLPRSHTHTYTHKKFSADKICKWNATCACIYSRKSITFRLEPNASVRPDLINSSSNFSDTFSTFQGKSGARLRAVITVSGCLARTKRMLDINGYQ